MGKIFTVQPVNPEKYSRRKRGFGVPNAEGDFLCYPIHGLLTQNFLLRSFGSYFGAGHNKCQSNKQENLPSYLYHWFDIFRSHLPEDQDTLEHLVQLDEAYFGGRKGRALFLGKQLGSRKLAYQLLSHTNPAREHAYKFLQTYIEAGTVLNTDGAAIYKHINDWWSVYHNRDIHKKFEFAHTSEIEGMFGVLKTFIRRMYHHVSCDKLPEYVSEFCCRFSHPEMFDSPYDYLLITLCLATLS